MFCLLVGGGPMAVSGSLLTILRRRKGQGVVEMLFGFLIFFAFFMAIVEFSHLLYAKVTLQHALRTAGRYMITGNTGMSGGAPIPRDQMIHNMFCTNVIVAGVQCPSLGANFTFTCLPTPGTTCSEAGGGPEQTVMVTVNLSKPTLLPFFSQFFPSGGVPIAISSTWKNEPFPAS
jgi:Flp pilus assembly protein TadG